MIPYMYVSAMTSRVQKSGPCKVLLALNRLAKSVDHARAVKFCACPSPSPFFLAQH